MTKIVRPLRSGQITIPSEFREELGISADSLLKISLINGELRIRPIKATQTAADSSWVEELYKVFEPVRKEAAKFSEEEINLAIDQAIQSVRNKRSFPADKKHG
jgi:AbrB family looped-hinge helix DNA binding protein